MLVPVDFLLFTFKQPLLAAIMIQHSYFYLFRGKVVLGYNEMELCMKGSGYQFIHAADMMYCADNHIRSELHTLLINIMLIILLFVDLSHTRMFCSQRRVVALYLIAPIAHYVLFLVIKTGESGLTVFRLLTKTRGWIWVQANARLVFKGGRPDFIVARQRALT